MLEAFGYGDVWPLHVPPPAWPALRRVSGLALALALASWLVAERERRGPIVRVLRAGAWSP
eukprot:6059129-Pleurochrysis_carterae.AAC.1